MPRLDDSILQAALIGYQHQLGEVTQKISEIQRRLGGRATAAAAKSTSTTDGAKPKRILSAAAIARIKAGQKRRWAAFHKQQKVTPAVKKATAKRTMSPERRAALAANLAKARAARAAKRAGA